MKDGDDSQLEPGASRYYEGICEARKGDLCTVTHTGVLGLASVTFEDGGGFLARPTSLRTKALTRREVAQAA